MSTSFRVKTSLQSNGTLELPENLLERLGWKPGTVLDLSIESDSPEGPDLRLLVHSSEWAESSRRLPTGTGDITELFGVFDSKPDVTVSIDEMDPELYYDHDRD